MPCSYRNSLSKHRNRWGNSPPEPGRKRRRKEEFLKHKLFRGAVRYMVLDLDSNEKLDHWTSREENIPLSIKEKLQIISTVKITRGNIVSTLKWLIRIYGEYKGSKFGKDIYSMERFMTSHSSLFETIRSNLMGYSYGIMFAIVTINRDTIAMQRTKYKL